MPSNMQPDATAAMLDAAAHDDTSEVLKQARAGADLNALNNHGQSALMMMAAHGDLIGLRGLLDLGADPDQKNPQNGRTALHESLYKDHSRAFETLIQNGANPNIPDDRGWTAVHITTAHHEVYCLELALKYGGDPGIQTETEGWNAAHIAARAGSYKLLWPLMNNNPDLVHQRDARERTPIFYAVEQLDNISIQVLRDNGADMSLQDEQGDGLAHLAARDGGRKSYRNHSVLEYVLAHGANPNARNKKEETPVFDAVHGDDGFSIEILAHYGANMNLVNVNQQTPLILAEQKKDLYITKKIEDMLASQQKKKSHHGLGAIAALILETKPVNAADVLDVFGGQVQPPAIWRAHKEGRKAAPTRTV